ncbi:hypothetical protein [Peribacillus kribbensis]|uniref:hypothetical protein n=1 Tax=Peribacillus kribbensis TaxID=356658 RepID=UPI0004127FD8|nr:hypothetical protein [Peribacillus kribbensis]
MKTLKILITKEVIEYSLEPIIVHGMDALVIESIFKISNPLKLLGIQSLITGLRPELAVGAVKLGINLADIITFLSVKDALKFLGVQYTII